MDYEKCSFSINWIVHLRQKEIFFFSLSLWLFPPVWQNSRLQGKMHFTIFSRLNKVPKFSSPGSSWERRVSATVSQPWRRCAHFYVNNLEYERKRCSVDQDVLIYPYQHYLKNHAKPSHKINNSKIPLLSVCLCVSVFYISPKKYVLCEPVSDHGKRACIESEPSSCCFLLLYLISNPVFLFVLHTK